MVDVGGKKNKKDESDEDTFSLANNIIVFMANGINHKFEQPVAFYFIKTLNGKERFDLVSNIVKAISEVSI